MDTNPSLASVLSALALVLWGGGAHAASSPLNRSSRIMGGRDALPGEVLWHVSQRVKPPEGAQRFGTDSCTGAIIHHRWILTAAHCALNLQRGQKELVYATIDQVDIFTNEGDPGLVAEVDTIIIHPQYVHGRSETFEYDIALYHTAAPLQLDGVKAQAVRLAGVHSDTWADPPAGTKLQVAGFGDTDFGIPMRLQVVDVDVMDRGECKTMMSAITDQLMCDFTPGGHATCHGDSGSGLVKIDEHNRNESELVAVTSFTLKEFDCIGGPGASVLVARHLEWIRSKGVPLV